MTSNVQHPASTINTYLRCCEEEITIPLTGEIQGTIPVWLNGNLLRNGPGTMNIGSSTYEHVFDGSALLHRFAINKGTVTYQCRYLQSQTLMKNRKAGRIVVSEFGTKAVPDPCNTIFKRIVSIFNLEDMISDNAGISVNEFGDQVYAMTDVATVYRFDPHSLETLEKKSLINSLIVCHSAHPHKMPNGDVYNIGLKIVLGLPKYVIVKFPHSKIANMFDLAEIVSEITPRWRFNPSYMHSFGITHNYYVIIEQPLAISLASALKATLLNDSFSTTLTWNSECETNIILVHRGTNVQTRYCTNALFFMHIVNTFEDNGKIIIDLCAYDDANIIQALYVEAIKNMKSNPDYAHWCHSHPKRIEVPLDRPEHTKIEAKLLADVKIEVPGINYLYNGRSYRYFYGVGSKDEIEFANSIIKIDTCTGDVKIWSEFDAFPSEPVFVINEDGKQEDDGILLSVLLWSGNDHAVTLLVLNAADLCEIARANFTTPSPAPNCIHGRFLKDYII